MRTDNEDQKSSQRFDSLPQHLREEIMAWLPPRSLLRCMSVSKSWRAHIAPLLDDPSFLANHLRNAAGRSRRLGLLFCLLTPPPYELSVATYDRHRGFQYAGAGFGLRASCDDLRKGTASHCDGLVLVQESSIKSAVLFNPAMNEWKRLTAPRSELGFSPLIWGLGYDWEARDYKIVRFDNDEVRDRRNLRANVYSLSTGSWRVSGTTSVELDDMPLTLSGTVIFSKGRCYFAVLSPENTLLSFDMSREEFRAVPQPDGLKGRDRCNTLAAWKDGLAIISCPFPKTNFKPIEIWAAAAEEGGGESCGMITWTRKHCIYPGMFLGEIYPYDLWFWTEDELVGQDAFGQPLSYNLRNGEVRYLIIPGVHRKAVSWTSWAIPYFESLVSVQPGKKKKDSLNAQ